jgi:SAM-dependent methyltransferase
MVLPARSDRPDYGHDRPDFAIYLPVGLILIIVPTILYSILLLNGWVGILALILGWTLGNVAVGFGMIFVLSKRGKLRQRETLLDAITWSGDEKVLDVGCGPGLLLVGAAKRLVTGKAVGIDIWRRTVEASNSPETALKNAEIEGVLDKVAVEDGDARELKMDDGTFDVVLARAVLHHIKVETERMGALREMIRVLKPGGFLGLILIDFNRLQKYIEVMKEGRISDVRILVPKTNPGARHVFGTVILVARKVC